ncbi:MAG: tRNA-(ms[2]io[6]A)-hydroxylase [Myxococcota bacterium]
MLKLAAATAPAWTDRVLADLDTLLIDHAHCEKKAAGMAINLIFQYPHHAFLHAPLSRLAREELVHFEQVLEILAARGHAFGAQKPAPYAGCLRKEVRTHEPARLLDLLLICALIEARSCERFECLANSEVGEPLRSFYAGLLASEARHHGIYVRLARELAPAEEVEARLRPLALREAEILADAPDWIRMHA